MLAYISPIPGWARNAENRNLRFPAEKWTVQTCPFVTKLCRLVAHTSTATWPTLSPNGWFSVKISDICEFPVGHVFFTVKIVKETKVENPTYFHRNPSVWAQSWSSCSTGVYYKSTKFGDKRASLDCSFLGWKSQISILSFSCSAWNRWNIGLDRLRN